MQTQNDFPVGQSPIEEMVSTLEWEVNKLRLGVDDRGKKIDHTLATHDEKLSLIIEWIDNTSRTTDAMLKTLEMLAEEVDNLKQKEEAT